jgi:transglutaminase-like putative cysteine protease
MKGMLLLGLAVFAVLAVSGCGSGDVSTTIGQTTLANTTLGSTSDTTSAAPESAPLVTIGAVGPTIIDVPYVGTLITATPQAGVTATFRDAAISVPEGAVSSNTMIEIRMLEAPFHMQPGADAPADGGVCVGQVYDFGPAGLVFTKPVTITLPYDESTLPAGFSEQDVALICWNGQGWVAYRGFVDAENDTVAVQFDRFEGNAVGPALVLALGTVIVAEGLYIWRTVTDPERTDKDAVLKGTAKEWITPDDPEVQDHASRAAILNTRTAEVKSLDDPEAAAWLAANTTSKDKDFKPILVYKNADGTYTKSVYNDGPGSNWQKPAHYFTRGTDEGGQLSGDCTDHANAAVSMLRAKGIPAKAVYGLKDGDPNAARHAWAEFKLGDKLYRLDDGYIYTPENDDFHFRTYTHITDPNDPYYHSMWDEEGQEPYDEIWFEESEFADFAGTYDGTWMLSGFFKNAIEVPVTFTIDKAGMVTGSLSWSGPTGVVHETQGAQTLTISGTFEGFVAEDGLLEADGPTKFVIDPVIGKGTASTSTARFPLEGRVSSDGEFRGSLGGDPSQPVTARRR